GSHRSGQILAQICPRRLGWGNDDFRIYTVLGNHDWHTSRAGAMAQVRFHETTRPFYMNGISYAAQPPAAKGEVEVFALDTHVLLAGEKVLDDKLADDGSEVATTNYDSAEPWSVPATPAERAMVADLEARLKASTAKWKIVIGHHPLWSSSGGKFQQSRSLRAALLPVLCRNADLYFAGHEHTLELATDDCSTAVPGASLPPMPAIVTGAAGKQRPLNTAFMAHQARNNPQYRSIYARGMVWGFAHVTLAGDTATVTMVSTPNDGSGATRVETRHNYQRRSGLLK
ncbi:MAG: metallophosphoesterase, partial [Polymorphobacter sp.]